MFVYSLKTEHLDISLIFGLLVSELCRKHFLIFAQAQWFQWHLFGRHERVLRNIWIDFFKYIGTLSGLILDNLLIDVVDNPVIVL